MTEFSHLIKDLFDNQLPTRKSLHDALHTMLASEADPVQVGAFLVALHMRGEDQSTLHTGAKVLLDMSVGFNNQGEQLLDTCGTGGDGLSTFNISSASAIVATACGAKVAKHGNRSVSGNCGSADLFEQAGAIIDMDSAGVLHTIQQTGMGFLFAPKFHPALAQVAPIRKALGVRTIFNLLGPLVNPAYPAYRVIGVFAKRWLEPIASTAIALGAQHVIVLHSQDGMDEISTSAPTDIFEVTADKSIERYYSITPEDFGIRRTDVAELTVSGPEQSFEKLRAVFEGAKGGVYSATVLNTGAALYVSGIADSIKQGVGMASTAIDEHRALKQLNQWVDCSRKYNKSNADAR